MTSPALPGAIAASATDAAAAHAIAADAPEQVI
jgi:hypothetical protein